MIKYTDKQIELRKLIKAKDTILALGGSRSGKTFTFCNALWTRAMVAPNSWHLILRKTQRAVKSSIFGQTFNIIKRLEPDKWKGVVLAKSETTAYFPNGSRIVCSGLDDDRIDSILGNEYATEYFNEASEITFDVYETALSRLAQICKYTDDGVEKELNLKCFIDYNPPSIRHWGFLIFFKGIKPDGSALKYADTYGTIKINPIDNKDNLPDKYFQTLEGYTGKKRQRFVLGEHTDDKEGSLFKQDWIDNSRCKWDSVTNRYILPELDKIVVALDPAVSTNKDSDETGILICGSKRIDSDLHYYILKDFTGKYTPKEWADIAINQYEVYKANMIIAEKNQGGDLVSRNIHVENNNIPIELIHAVKGKAIRAEPVSNLCERGYIHFHGMLVEVETEITDWIPNKGMKSPNRLDALVYGVLYLMENSGVASSEEFVYNNVASLNEPSTREDR